MLHELLGGFFPVLPIKGNNLELRQVDIINTAKIDRPLCGCNAGTTERTDAAMAARVVLGSHRVELIEREIALSREDAKMGVICAVPKRTLSAAQGTVAINGYSKLTLKFKRDAAAMT